VTASSSPRPNAKPAAATSLSKPAKPASPATPAEPTASAEPAASGAAAARGRHAAEPSLGQLVSDASTHLSTLVHSEIELAKLELRSTLKNVQVGAGAFIGAAVLLLFSLVYFFQAVAETLDRYLVPRWVAFFIVFGLLVVVAGLLAWIGIRKVKRVRAPEKTIKTTKETVDYLKKSRG
jgi:uncharacterized integral membrane protein